ncbi:MAG: EVE domain-containing protein, partial [Ignavibacteriales bacterium]|nr:EVE domain-containing protein [Ignavibacteriales bacterium]
MAKKYWLFKSEFDEFSIDDLASTPDCTTYWDGVRNYQARNFIRDEMKSGDGVLFYHSNTEPLAVVGICEIVKDAYPDHTAFDPENSHYDAGSRADNPRWYMVDIKFVKKLLTPVTLTMMRESEKLQNMR